MKIRQEYFVKNIDLKNPPLKASRTGFAEAIMELGKTNPNVVVLGGDVSPSVQTDRFRDAYPDRFFSVGIAEQDMMGTAAGLAVVGKTAIASTYGEFAAGRPFDQIRQSLAYSRMDVKICASHCGITVGPDGATHQSLEDVAIMRVLPHMNVLTPCDANQTYNAVMKAAYIKEPFFIRFYRDNSPNYSNPDIDYDYTKAHTLVDGNDVTIIASGLMVWEALVAAEELYRHHSISARVINMHSIKPLDHEIIFKAAQETGCIVTAEDHQKHCGLFGAVSEAVVQRNPVPMDYVAVNDTFGESAIATQMRDLMKKYEITSDNIVAKVKKVINRK
jgi:transketolase